MTRTVGFVSPWVTFASAGERIVHINATFMPNAPRAALTHPDARRVPKADVSAEPPEPGGACPACKGRGHHNEVTCESCYGRGGDDVNQARCSFPLDDSGAWESHAMVRPQSAAAFAVALTSACHDVGLRPPETVTEHGGHVRFWWHAKPRRAWAQLDAEGEVLFCFDAPPALSSFEAVQAGRRRRPGGATARAPSRVSRSRQGLPRAEGTPAVSASEEQLEAHRALYEAQEAERCKAAHELAAAIERVKEGRDR